MLEPLEFGRATTPVRAPVATLVVLTLLSCSPESLTDTDGIDREPSPQAQPPSLATAYAGGIPFGLFALPTERFGSIYNGGLRNARVLVDSAMFLSTLAAIKSRGGKVVLQLTGGHRQYLDDAGHFSFLKWKERVNQFKLFNFSSYITDGTIIGHFLIDEPNDPRNFGGQPVSGLMVEAMAKYSKSLWPQMATIVRADASYLAQWPGYTYLDATWAQYVYRKGEAGDYIRRNVADAQKLGLALVTGLNIMRGGPNGATMTPAQIQSWGSTLLSSSYPCAFVSWVYNSTYFSTTSVKDAMKYLRAKAQNRTFKTCRS